MFKSITTYCLAALTTLIAAAGSLAADGKPAPTIEKEETWQIILMSGQRMGHTRSLVEPFERDGKPLVRTAIETHLTIKRFGQTLRVNTFLRTEETPDGDLLKFDFEMANPPAGSTKYSGVINGDKLTLTNEVSGKKSTSEKAWDTTVKSPSYQERVLRDHPLQPGGTQTFAAYMPEFGKVATIKIIADKEEEVELHDGKTAKALKVKLTQSAVPGMATVGWIGDKGETLKSSTSLLGTEMVTFAVSREEALKKIDTEELDIAVGTLIKVKPIPGVHDRGEITYRITIPDQDPTEFLAVDGVQTIKKVDDHTVDLTIKVRPIPAKADASKPPSKEFLAASEFLQADDPKVKEHADAAAGKLTDAAQIARTMERYVDQKLEKKNFSTALASAAEVAENLEGDCTEHACLLAAMLRAKKIPSRVAVGIVYVELDKQPSFGGHMWTEAWLGGQWVPLDATLGNGGTSVGHIKLGDSSFSDPDATPIGTFAPLMLAIGTMKIEVVK